MIERGNTSKVSVIVVNWNGAGLLDACLGALSSQTYKATEIILVDNGSSDASVQHVKRSFPQVKLIELKENTGFTGGNLAGLQVADGEFIALINNDARVETDWIERIVRPMVNDPHIGICASKILLDGTGRIDSVGDGMTTAAVGFNRGFGAAMNQYGVPEPVFGACAAAALYRRRMIDHIGFFDDDFFLYDEDVDLSFRAQLAGWKCVYVPDAVVYHKANATAVRLSDVHVYYHTRNLEFVWVKNMPKKLMLQFAHHKLIQEFGAFCYLCLRHGKWAPFFRAKIDALKMLPKVLKKRVHIQANQRTSDEYIRQILTPIGSSELLRQKLIQLFRG
jgi:GT2 family glycosyltransferase